MYPKYLLINQLNDTIQLVNHVYNNPLIIAIHQPHKINFQIIKLITLQ